jgi:flagellar hook-associated protein 1 FlgK
MSNLFGITTSALTAFQTAIAVTSNNIANANTQGYAVETADLTSAIPQTTGESQIGNGVNVSGISRAYSTLAENQLNAAQTGLSQINGLQTYTNQIDNIVGTTAGGVSTALQNYYNAWSTLAGDPASAGARAALLGQAQSLAQTFQSTSTRLQNLDTQINTGITADVSQINSDVQSIATLNSQIVVATAQGGGQPPNDLLDQRDAVVQNLNKLANVSTTVDANGALNVFIGTGQPLVLQGTVTPLTVIPNVFNASQLEVSTATNGNNTLSASITGGDLGGLLAARTQAVNPTLNQLGQIAVGLEQSANAQQNAGLDLTGNFGANLFSVAAPAVTAARTNTSTVTAAATVANVGALTTNDYVLSYTNGAYSLKNAATDAAVAFTGPGTGASPVFSADGLSITLSGKPASGDQFLIQPTAIAAGSFGVALTNPSQLAAAGALETTTSPSNTGTAAIGTPTVVTATNPNLLNKTTITFTSPTAYTIGGTSYPYTSGATIAQNGWQVAISGTPAAGDTFTVQAGSSGNDVNALAMANQETQGVLASGTISINGATSGLITAVGTQAQQVNTAQTAQSAVGTQALQTVQSISGVNLDEEAANLLKWQQAYQASAQAFSIGNSVFTSLLSAVGGTGS